MTAEKRKLNLRRTIRAEPPPAAQGPPWPVLVVDDDPDVHRMTEVLLRDFVFDGRGFETVGATSAAEAMEALRRRPDVPVALLDVVMETPDAGLGLVRHIRQTLGDRRMRIILRTGQPGDAPEREVMLAYDINDYKSKTELTAQRLFTTLVAALRAWRDIATIDGLNRRLVELNASLETKVQERTAELAAALERETEAKRQQRQFLSMVSHEFRTPLAIIDSATQMLLLRGAAAEDSARRRLESIRGGVQRLLRLIESCLADEQLERGALQLNRSRFDLACALASVIAAQQAASGGRDFRVDAPASLPTVGDPELLSLALNNLVGNAVKYSPEGTPVDIHLQAEGNELRVIVADAGIGIPEDDIPRIFERFHRAMNARGIAGTGIGLHLVRQIVELHGGTVRVDSGVGRGSRFVVRLPCVETLTDGQNTGGQRLAAVQSVGGPIDLVVASQAAGSEH